MNLVPLHSRFGPTAGRDGEVSDEIIEQSRQIALGELHLESIADRICVARLGRALDQPRAAQVHVHKGDRGIGFIKRQEGINTEALITDRRVIPAGAGGDCPPVVIDAGVLAVVHGHNKNVQNGLIPHVVDLMSKQERFAGIQSVLIGPGICGGCYEFSWADAEGFLPLVYNGHRRFVRLHPTDRTKVFLDLVQLISYQFERLGVPSHLIYPPRDCTYHGERCDFGPTEHRRFYSARRNEPGRNLCLVVSDELMPTEALEQLAVDQEMREIVTRIPDRVWAAT